MDRDAGLVPIEPVVPASVDELIVALPKVELHVHLEGSMQPALLLELAAKHGVVGLPASLEAVREWYEFRDFPHFIDVYLAAVQTLREQDDFTLLVAQTAATLAAQNVRYAEVIITPWLHLDRGISAEHMFGGLERGRQAAEREVGVRLRWLADFPGHYGAACGERTLDAVLEASLDSVIGFNVGGIEVDRDQFAEVFDRARAASLHSVPHAGETHGPDRIWSAIARLGAERIGHGIRCLDDPALVKYLRDTQLPLDVCPTSNWRTGAVSPDRPHPLPALLDAGLMVTLNSDDPPMFGTDLTNEYRVAYGLGLTPADLADLARNAVRASFMDHQSKAAVLAEIDEVCATRGVIKNVGS
ncbi:MAG: adenosine deaminase [Pseudonocardiaceae bacterium]